MSEREQLSKLYTKHATLTDTTLTELFEVPRNHSAIIKYIFVANHEVSTNTVDLYWDFDGTPQLYIFDGASIAGASNISLSNGGGPLFVLHERETVKVQAISVGVVEVAVTLELTVDSGKLRNF